MSVQERCQRCGEPFTLTVAEYGLDFAPDALWPRIVGLIDGLARRVSRPDSGGRMARLLCLVLGHRPVRWSLACCRCGRG